MFYITYTHPEAVGTWCLCSDGAIVERFGEVVTASGNTALHDPGKTQATDALMRADSSLWASLVAAGGDALVPWSSEGIAFVGTPTSDKRQLEEGGESFREFPQPLMLQMQTAWGHDGAVISGRIDQASVKNGAVPASGVFDSGAMGSEAARLVSGQMLDGVSVDLGRVIVEFEAIEMDDDGWVTDWIDHFTEWEQMGATLTPWPAFANAKVTSAGAPADAVAASVQAAGPVKPDPSRFEVILNKPTPIDDDGAYVWGHMATWDTCHIGRQGSCVVPPHSKQDYSFFTTGYVECDDGCKIPTGVLSLGGGHATPHASAREAISHYDSTSTAVADVAIGEDEFGIWIAGAFRSTVTDEQLREFRAASPSGDWRNIDGNLELVAVLQVNVPGFPVPRQSVAASGVVESLVAAVAPRAQASVDPSIPFELRRWMSKVDTQLKTLRPQVIDNLADRVRPSV